VKLKINQHIDLGLERCGSATFIFRPILRYEFSLEIVDIPIAPNQPSARERTAWIRSNPERDGLFLPAVRIPRSPNHTGSCRRRKARGEHSATMAWRTSLSRSVKEIRVLLCQSSPASAPARYQPHLRPLFLPPFDSLSESASPHAAGAGDLVFRAGTS
jgi:hypothetical protein